MSGTAIALSSYSYPTAVSWGSSHLEVFALDTGVYPDWKYKDSTASAANEWSPENSTFEYIGSSTAPFQYGIAAIARDTQNVDIFITGSDFGLYHKSHSTNLAWVPSLTKWEAHGGMLSSAPSVVSWSSQRLDVFGIGEAPTYQLLQMTWDEGQWGGWIGHPAASMSAHAPAVVSWGPGRLDVFALSARDHALYYRYYDGKQWHPKDSLTNLGGYGTSRPVTISLQQGRIDIFMRGGDAGIWHNVYANATWSDWTAISVGKSVHTEPSVVSCVEGVIDLFAWAEDNSLIHKRLDIFTATWTPDTDFDKLRDGLAGPPSAVSDGAGSLHVFAYMQAGDLGHLSWNESSKTWSPGTGIESLGSGDWS
ncbi:uncharacterized protein A1O9_03220 [Exophiala aquamarina CBS 119918]|uniref:PLL-like beta propeller domain-containing protein n=1 Tax=Exophiala aquamarina CBS 119918 TaxID=1182545 RepID=A0A072PPH9_9EURO|nr:uncharacterized protein A1O9_03220 [Exophiala aquamarina CBS 119918]KEF61652.1 hypothetical protein A1O9_03220 [Exophiala aquamarina CBS 119918]